MRRPRRRTASTRQCQSRSCVAAENRLGCTLSVTRRTAVGFTADTLFRATGVLDDSRNSNFRVSIRLAEQIRCPQSWDPISKYSAGLRSIPASRADDDFPSPIDHKHDLIAPCVARGRTVTTGGRLATGKPMMISIVGVEAFDRSHGRPFDLPHPRQVTPMMVLPSRATRYAKTGSS